MQVTHLLQLNNPLKYQLSTLYYRILQEINKKLPTMLKPAQTSTKEKKSKVNTNK